MRKMIDFDELFNVVPYDKYTAECKKCLELINIIEWNSHKCSKKLDTRIKYTCRVKCGYKTYDYYEFNQHLEHYHKNYYNAYKPTKLKSEV